MIFDVTFAPDCRNDMVSFQNPFDASYTHVITSPPSSEPLDPQLTQNVANCPVLCTLDTNGITDDAISFSPATGIVTLSQFNWSLDTASTQVTVTCDSTLSERADSFQSQTFTVTYSDECRDAEFVLADITASMSSFVWPTPADIKPFTPVTSNLNCAPYTYSIIADPQIQSGLSINTQIPAIVIQMESLSQARAEPWIINVQVCATLGNNEPKCEVSNDIELMIRDPCLITSINADSVDRVL